MNGSEIQTKKFQINLFLLEILKLNRIIFRCNRMEYLLANEWATSASNSRLFRIFLPLERSGTLTESIAFFFYTVFTFAIILLSLFNIFSYQKDNAGIDIQHNFLRNFN